MLDGGDMVMDLMPVGAVIPAAPPQGTLSPWVVSFCVLSFYSASNINLSEGNLLCEFFFSSKAF
jgi:hypothetical protein